MAIYYFCRRNNKFDNFFKKPVAGTMEPAWIIVASPFDLFIVDGKCHNPERLSHTTAVGRLTGLGPGMSCPARPAPESLALVVVQKRAGSLTQNIGSLTQSMKRVRPKILDEKSPPGPGRRLLRLPPPIGGPAMGPLASPRPETGFRTYRPTKEQLPDEAFDSVSLLINLDQGVANRKRVANQTDLVGFGSPGSVAQRYTWGT